MLSWSVIEYIAKYEAAGELEHVKGIIKWGTDYFLKTFNSSADTIDRILAQVGQGDTSKGPSPNDHYCWVRPEDIAYPRPVYECHSCSYLAAEMADALADASVVFKDSKTYSEKLVHMQKLFLSLVGIRGEGIALVAPMLQSSTIPQVTVMNLCGVSLFL